MKQINTCISLLLVCLCCIACTNTQDCKTHYDSNTTNNVEANNVLKKLQRVQTLQFELINHPEYQTALPESIITTYTEAEIDLAFKNLKWKRN